MFWNDIAEIKAWVNSISNRMTELQMKLDLAMQEHEDRGSLRQMIEDVMCSDDEYNTFNRLHDKLNHLLNDDRRKEEVELATQTLDKFEDYMKNVHVLNSMINEFKGCVSLARGSLQERKEVAQKESETAHLLAKIAENLRKQEKKSLKPRKSVKKKAASRAPLSE